MKYFFSYQILNLAGAKIEWGDGIAEEQPEMSHESFREWLKKEIELMFKKEYEFSTEQITVHLLAFNPMH